MKAGPLLKSLRECDDFSPLLVDTGQHYDHEMSGIFMAEFGMGAPDIQLKVGSGSHGEQTSKILYKYEQVLLEQKPDAIIVIGDVNSTVACALAASKLHIPVIHLEAGLRSHDRGMPEEINRLLTDQLADLLWTPSPDGDEHLLASGIPIERIDRVGNIMIDTLVSMLPTIEKNSNSQHFKLTPMTYSVVTLHRPSNVDVPVVLNQLLDELIQLEPSLHVVWPMHPRTRARIIAIGRMDELIEHGIEISQPLGYVDFMSLVSNSRMVITDSGGIQEETSWLGIPCLTLRPNTERPITITEGTNRLITPELFSVSVKQILENDIRKKVKIDLWDGKTAERCIASLKRFFAV